MDDVPLFQQTVASLGRDVVPAGADTFEDLVDAYKALLTPGQGPVHITGMTAMAECRAAVLAAREQRCFPVWVSWECDEDGESATGVEMLAALIVAEGMGAAAFGVRCPSGAEERLKELEPYAVIPLYALSGGTVAPHPYSVRERDPDGIPCATGTSPCFLTRTVDVGEELACGPDLLEKIIEAEDNPVGAVKICVTDLDDVDIFAREQYAIRDALCLWSDVPQVLEAALRVYQGRAFYDGTGELEAEELDRLSKLYGLIVL